MRKIIILLLLPVCFAETPGPIKLSDSQKATLYKALADFTLAQNAAKAADAKMKETQKVFQDLIAEYGKFCGAPVVEKEGAMVDCSEPPKTPEPKEPVPLKNPATK